jgi:hypothetical protein
LKSTEQLVPTILHEQDGSREQILDEMIQSKIIKWHSFLVVCIAAEGASREPMSYASTPK